MTKPLFGAAIPREQWIQRTVSTDPFPRLPFSNGLAHSPATEPQMSGLAAFGYAVAWGFALGVLVLVP